jgi:drug/metabolite transporter (DMT)-like permease
MSLKSRLAQTVARIPNTYKIHALLLTMALIYGAFFPILKLYCLEIGGIQVAVLRQMGFALFVVAVGWTWSAWSRLPLFHPHFKKDWWIFILVGFFGVFWMQTFSAIAMQYTSSFNATLCMASIPLQVIVFNAIFKIEQLNWLKLLGVLVGTTGIVWLVLSQFFDASLSGNATLGTNPLLGNGLILLNAFFFSIYNISVKYLMKHYTPLDVLSWNFLQAGFVMLILSFFTQYIPFLNIPNVKEALFLFTHQTPIQWFFWIYVVVIAGFIGYWVHHKGLSKTSANNVAAYGMLQPVIAAILGAWWLHEPFTLTMGLAGIVTLVGVAITNVKR